MKGMKAVKYHEFTISDRDIEFLRKNKKFVASATITDEQYKAAAKLSVGQTKPAKLQSACSDEEGALSVGVVHRLLRIVLDLPPKQRRRERVAADLRQIKFPDSVADTALALIFDSGLAEAYDSRQSLDAVAGSLSELGWRIDINICTSHVGKILEPVISFSLARREKPNSREEFEVPLSKFHQLRFTVARLLREMSALEEHPAMKLDA